MPESDSYLVDILYEQGAVFVLNKPGGLLTQAPPGIDSLELRFRKLVRERTQQAGNIYVGVPHRLDRPVSGAMVMVRNVRAAQRISQQLESRTVRKIYWAVVEGEIDEPAATWLDWMRKLPDEAKSEMVPENHAEAKRAVLHYRVLGMEVGHTLVEIELETGRTHQIRLQFSAHGHPITGDHLYGASTKFGFDRDDVRKQWIALHARELSFEHPIDKTPVHVVAPLNSYWQPFSKLGFHLP